MLGMSLENGFPWLFSNLILPGILVAVAAYFCGCFNGAVVVSKYILRNDIRTHGSGNAGLTNFYRVFGGPLTAVVVLMDVVKMIAAVWIGVLTARFWGGGIWQEDMILYAKYWAGAFCIIGHVFPCMFHFKGGKGVLSGGTLLWMIDWRIALVSWGGFLLLAALTKWVSLGSVWAGAAFPVTTLIFYRDPVLVILALVSGGLLVWKHRGNIQRILNGTESKFAFHHKEKKP